MSDARTYQSWARSWIQGERGHAVGGAWRSGDGRRFPVYDPSTGEAIASLPEAGPEDVDAAVAAARAAFEGAWSAMTRAARAGALRRVAALIRSHKEELAALESLTNGKTYAEALGDDLPEAADVFDYYAGWIDKLYGETSPVEAGYLSFTRREPVGVAALVVPWNFPLLLAAWKIAPALAMGNTAVVKPAPYTSHSLLRLAEILQDDGALPPGVLNVVTGDALTGELLSNHRGIDKISFTGSTAVGRRVLQGAAASNLKTVTLELGGKSPNVLFADTPDLEQAVRRTFTAMFSHKGEKCSEPTRLLVEAPLYDEVLARLAALADAVRCGDPFDAATGQGPQCHRAHFERVLDYLAVGKAEGARLVAGGHRDESAGPGYFVRPTVFADVRPGMRIEQEEIFGPVLSVLRFEGEDEAIAIANGTPYGLAAGLYTADVSRAHRVAARLDAGMVFVNHYGCYDFAAPFGGFKQSGWGKEMARHSLDAYTKLKSVWIKYE